MFLKKFKMILAGMIMVSAIGVTGCSSVPSNLSSSSENSSSDDEIKYSLSIKPTIKGQKYIDNYKNLKENIQSRKLKSAIKKADNIDDSYTMYIDDMSVFDGYYETGSYRESNKEAVKEYDSDSIDHMLFGIGTDNNENTDAASTVIYTTKETSASTKARKKANDSITSSNSTSSEATTSDSSSLSETIDTTALVTSVRYENSTHFDNGKFTLQTFNIISTEYKDSDGDGTYESNGDSTYKQVNILLKDNEAPHSISGKTEQTVNIDSDIVLSDERGVCLKISWDSDSIAAGWKMVTDDIVDNNKYAALKYEFYDDANKTTYLGNNFEDVIKSLPVTNYKNNNGGKSYFNLCFIVTDDDKNSTQLFNLKVIVADTILDD